MIGLNTNVLVRYVSQDDPVQSPKATNLIESLTAGEPGFIDMVSVMELVWVLQSCYQATKSEIVDVLETLLRTKELVVERAEIVWQALRRFSDSKASFANCLMQCGLYGVGVSTGLLKSAKMQQLEFRQNGCKSAEREWGNAVPFLLSL